jgi:2-hydroxy-3-oxopropionate reductase
MKIGFIGLGVMGLPMSLNLVKAGFEVRGFNRSPEKLAKFSASGGTPAASLAEAASGADIVVTMLPDSPDVRLAALGPGGIAQSAKAGALVVDMSSIDPLASRGIHAELAKKSISMIDAPVSGGEPKAIDGTLSIMAGGDEADVERAMPVLAKMGASVVRVGPIGSGNVAKLANQAIVAAGIAAAAEALTLAEKAGADPRLVFQAIRGGLAGSAVLEAKAPMMLSGDARPGFRIGLHLKDLRNVLSAGEGLGAPLPVSKLTASMLEELCSEGFSGLDHSALAKYYEKRAMISLSKAGGPKPA